MSSKQKLAWVRPVIRKVEVTEGILNSFPDEVAAHFDVAAQRAAPKAKAGGR